MTGTIINIITVFFGGLLGLFLGNRLPEKVQQTVVAGIGLFTAAIGVSMFLETKNPIIVLVSLMLGGILGEVIQIEAALEGFGGWLQLKFGSKAENGSSRERFIEGFLTASLVFCIGPMTILGSIQDGLTGDYNLLAIKSTLDGFAAIAFSATFGVGVLFSILVILGFQGGLTLLASQITHLFSSTLIEAGIIPELSAVGGVMLIGLAISSLLELKKIRVGNFLLALVFAPLIVVLLDALGLG